MRKASKSKRSGLPRLQDATDFAELKEIINIRSTQVPTNYMDKLLLENTNKTISRILEEDWWPYAEKIGDQHFHDKSRVKQHVKFREERGWVYEYSGTPGDPIIHLINCKKKRML